MHKYDLVGELINVKNDSNESKNRKRIINLCIKYCYDRKATGNGPIPVAYENHLAR